MLIWIDEQKQQDAVRQALREDPLLVDAAERFAAWLREQEPTKPFNAAWMLSHCYREACEAAHGKQIESEPCDPEVTMRLLRKIKMKSYGDSGK